MSQKEIRIAVAGAGGRMGRQLIQSISQIDGAILGAAFEREGSSLLGTDAGELAGISHLNIKVTDNLINEKDKFDVFIDFIEEAAKQIAIVFAANFSVGVNVVLKLLEKAAKVMGEYTDIEIVEAHHRHKVDAPSGTALAMGNAIADTLNIDLNTHAIYCRDRICNYSSR